MVVASVDMDYIMPGAIVQCSALWSNQFIVHFGRY